MTVDLDALEALARAATPGPWRVSMSGYSVKSDDADVPIVAAIHGGAQATQRQIERWLPNADFIADTNPAAVLELVQRLRAAEKKLDHECECSLKLARELADRDERLRVAETALRSLVDVGNDISEIAESFVQARDVGSLRNYGSSVASIARHAVEATKP